MEGCDQLAKNKKGKTKVGAKLARLLRKLPADQQTELRQTLAWLSSDEPERLTEWWVEHGGSLDASVKHVRELRDEFASTEAERRANDPRRDRLKVSAADVLAAFDRWRLHDRSDTAAAAHVEKHETFDDWRGRTTTVTKSTVLTRVKERREGKSRRSTS
jgi:hypothetical protein